MPQFLLELFSEEIPARMQTQAGRDLARMAEERLKSAGLPFEGLSSYAGPRRLTLVIEGLPSAQADRVEELKGPRTNAPPQALDGFLRKTGLARSDLTERDGVYFANLSQKGRPTSQILTEMVEAILKGFPWPKSMRWGSGAFRWVRPLKRIVALFDGVVIPVEISGIISGDLTEGHRFMGSSQRPFQVTDFDQYRTALLDHFVILDQADRKHLILQGARAVCAEKGLELVEDEGLLEEVSGLAEWPTPVLGVMDPDFLDLPSEVIRTSMRTHQKYFAVRKPGEGALAPFFLVVANIDAPDGGAILAAGNAKVLSARLNDARFFWNEDRKISLEARREKLKGVTFHARLGTLYARVERIEALAQEIAPWVGADPKLAAKAARLAKADLATGMVGEFPELQGVMGGYYARLEPASVDARPSATSAPDVDFEADGSEDPGSSVEDLVASPERAGGLWFEGLTGSQVDQVADAVRDHYKPAGPSDSVPTAPVTIALALADKLDTLVGFFAIDEKPTGSKDPFALRRAALGVIRILLQSKLTAPLAAIIERHWSRVADQLASLRSASQALAAMGPEGGIGAQAVATGPGEATGAAGGVPAHRQNEGVAELLAFFADRLKVLLRDEGKRHDLVDAVFALGNDDLVDIVARVEALSGFLATENGASLLAGYKRATNILKAEAKKGEEADLGLNPELSDGAPPEEAALVAALRVEQGRVDQALADGDFISAMRRLSHLRGPVDAFFDKVLVNDPDTAVRLNRLRLLTQVRDTANRVADFSLISG